MKKTMVRVLAGAAMFGAAALMVGVAPSDAAAPARAAVTASAKPALNPAHLTYKYKCWGHGAHCNVAVYAPTGWKFTQLSQMHAKFTDPSNTWMLRVNGGLNGKVSTNTAATQRINALHGVPGLKILSRSQGTVASKVPWSAPPVAFTTITYTYRDGARGQRWVSTRFVDTYQNGKRAYIEITVGGRPQDQAGLKRVLGEATQRVALVG